ncbi:hypothetical protein [Planctomycetes bacterium TBK1r]|uniref:Uncharacterized protein n=1 Tax=Stieleria magnilauensis TaxID=2527963 RepID=A0ABX5Y1M4_9BACT|nr:hypothetical protein TBK1r_49910 [Planctomycetes bacterium TBK1r]
MNAKTDGITPTQRQKRRDFRGMSIHDAPKGCSLRSRWQTSFGDNRDGEAVKLTVDQTVIAVWRNVT